MRQKYVVSLDDAQEKLNIKEYAIIDKNLRKVAFHTLKKGSFSFLCEETYESDTILKSISKGMDALVAILRTPNIFPSNPTPPRSRRLSFPCTIHRKQDRLNCISTISI